MQDPEMQWTSCQLNERSIVMLPGYPGLLIFKGLLCLGHFSCGQLFVYQYHSTPWTRRKVEGEDGP